MNLLRKEFKILFYLFVGSAILFAIAFSVLEDPEQDVRFAGLFAVALGLSLMALVGDGVQKGAIRGRRRSVEKAKNPANFWGIVTVYSLIGLILLGVGIWQLLTR